MRVASQPETGAAALLWILFAYGAVIHLLLFRALVHGGYSPPADTSFVNQPLTNAALALLGGIFVAALMSRLPQQSLGGGRLGGLALVAKAGVYGVIASVLTLQSL